MPFLSLDLRASIDVAEPSQVVWAFLSDPQNAPLWDRSVATVEPLNELPLGVGWEGLTTAPSGMRQRFRMTRWEPEHHFAFELLESSMFTRAELAFDLEALERGTRIIHRIRMRLRNPLLGPVLRLTARNALGRDLASLAGALRERAAT